MTSLVAYPSTQTQTKPEPTTRSLSDFVVDAFDNSFSRGYAAETISLVSGQRFTVAVDPSELWSHGDLHGWSTANGLDGDLYATGNDASGQPAGTYIGTDFGPCKLGKFYAPFGTLVGKIGGGDFFVVGTNYSGIADNTGILRLYYWDENRIGNTGFVTAKVRVTPERSPTGFQDRRMFI